MQINVVTKMVIWIHAMTCSLSRLDRSVRQGTNGTELEDERAIVDHVFELGRLEIEAARRALRNHADDSMRRAAAAALRHVATLPNSEYVIPERTPDDAARGTGRDPDQTHIPQFGSGTTVAPADVPT